MNDFGAAVRHVSLPAHEKHLTRSDRIYVERINISVFIRKMRLRADLPGMTLDAFNVENPVFIAYARRTGNHGVSPKW
jgi:hypothetical protein